jgi:hypothetical protein
MSVTPNEIGYYGSANMPEADSATVGGAVDFTKKVFWTDVGANDTIDAVSSSASDTATKVQLKARDAAGNIQTSAAGTLTGTTPITNVGAIGTIERLLAAVVTGGAIAGLTDPGGTTAVGDVALYRHTAIISAHTAQTGAANTTGTTPPLFKLQSGDGASVAVGQIIRIKTNTGANQLRQIVAVSGYGTDVVAVNRDWGTLPDATSTYDVYQGMLFELSPNQVKAQARVFATAQADAPGGSSRTFYEKIFVVNNDTAIDLTGAQIEIVSETPGLPSGALLDMAVCKALNDTATAANRQTLPANGDTTALTFVTQPAFVSVIASPGALKSGAAPNSAGAQGVWVRLTLPAGTAAYKGSALPRAQGATT